MQQFISTFLAFCGHFAEAASVLVALSLFVSCIAYAVHLAKDNER